jgi:hypothetical protein
MRCAVNSGESREITAVTWVVEVNPLILISPRASVRNEFRKPRSTWSGFEVGICRLSHVGRRWTCVVGYPIFDSISLPSILAANPLPFFVALAWRHASRITVTARQVVSRNGVLPTAAEIEYATTRGFCLPCPYRPWTIRLIMRPSGVANEYPEFQ